MQKRTIILVGVGVLVVGIACLALLVFSFPIFECHDTLIAEAANRRAAVVATAYVRDCGATTRSVTHVNLRPLGKAFDGDGFPIIFLYDGETRVALHWVEDRRLVVQYSQKGRSPFKRMERSGNLDITYIPVP